MQPPLSTPTVCLGPRLSPDGAQLAMGILGGGGYDLWVYNWHRDLMTRLTLKGGFNGYPVWSPDGKVIAFESDRAEGVANLYWKRADGGGETKRLTQSTNSQSPSSFSSDGKRLAFSERNPDNGFDDIWTLPIQRGASDELAPGSPEPFLRTPANKSTPMFSPDGRWLAYVSDESGTAEVYVRPFPNAGGVWQISSGGGLSPIWSRHDRALFFKTPDRRIMAVRYTFNRDSFLPDKPRLWLEKQIPESGLGQDFDVAPDGKRLAVQILASEAASETTTLHANLLLHFSDELRRKVRSARE